MRLLALVSMLVHRDRVRRRRLLIGLCWLACLFAAPQMSEAQGIFLTGTGPINQAMGGAAVAAPIDSAGALNWNPGSISGLRSSEMAVAIGFVVPTCSLDSQAFGLSGSTPGQSGVTPVPTMSWVYRNPNSRWTYGIGMYGIGGFSSNYPASSLASPQPNPILTPQPPFGIGVGRVYAHAEIYQFAPTISPCCSGRRISTSRGVPKFCTCTSPKPSLSSAVRTLGRSAACA